MQHQYIKTQKNKNRKRFVIFLFSCFLIFLFLGTNVVLAQQRNFGLGYATALELGTRDIRSIVMQLINVVLGFLGVVAIVIVLYGGFLYMTSMGSSEKVEKAKKLLINGAIGLTIILTSYAITYFVFSALNQAAGIDPGRGCNNNGICEAGEGCSSCASDCGVCPAPGGGGSGGNFAVSWVDPQKGEDNVTLCRLTQIKFNREIDPDTIDNTGSWAGGFTVNSSTALGDINFQLTISDGTVAGDTCSVNTDCRSSVCDSGGTGTCQGNLVPGLVTMWPNNEGLTFNNGVDFESNITYRAVIKSDSISPPGLQSNGGSYLSLGNYMWTFTTGTLTDTQSPTVVDVFPADVSTDVCLASVVEAIFDESMDVASLLSTDNIDPMDPNSFNSLYFSSPIPSISGFKKTVASPEALIATPRDLYNENASYIPVLDSDIIRDSCGNYLDGDADGVAEGSAGGDDYAPLPVGIAPDWSFTTGTTVECTPEITSITPSAYYDDVVTVDGHYFTLTGDLIFNNSVNISGTGVNYCFDGNYIPTQECLVSWGSSQIQVKLPSTGGASNGAISGDVVVAIGSDNISNSVTFDALSPNINTVAPAEGGKDQFVTLLGVNFGSEQGVNDNVYFKKVSDPTVSIKANYPCAGSVGWIDSQIIISVPDDEIFVDGDEWYLQVVLNEGSDNYWSSSSIFTFKDILPGPGICSILNTNLDSEYLDSAEGMLDDSIQFSGVRFVDVNEPVEQEANFGNYVSPIPANDISGWSYGPPDTVNAIVPNISTGVVSVFVNIDGQNSNMLNFTIHPSDKGPRIDYFEATSGPVGEYITIYGGGFGNKKGSGDVEFNGISATNNGGFDFPDVCANNFWRDSQIVVKVPTGAVTGPISVINDIGLMDDTTDLTPFDFDVTAGTPGPGICNIKPASGPVGVGVDIFGERFSDMTDIKFFNDKSALGYTIINDESISQAVVPDKTTPDDASDDAVSGPISVEIDSQISNGYTFQIFDCRQSSDGCGAIGYDGYDCCYTGACVDPATGGCDNPTAATYSWDFSSIPDQPPCDECIPLKVLEELCPPAAVSSPSPYIGKADACLNSVVYVKFNVEIDSDTVAGGITVSECNTGGSFDNNSCTTVVSPAAGYPALLGSNKEILFIPVANLSPDTWYQVVIDQDLESVEGFTLDSDYIWNYKVKEGTDLCDIDIIFVTPQDGVITLPFGTQDYDSLPIGDCTALNPLSYDWSWQSSIEDIATITNSDISPVDSLVDPSQVATAIDKDGITQISAAVPAVDASGDADLVVRLREPEVIDFWPDCDEACLNATMGAEFNISMDLATLNTTNIELYKWICGNGTIETGEDCDDGNLQSGDGCSGIPTTTGAVCNAITDQTSCEDKKIDCFWDGSACQYFTDAFTKLECQDTNGYWDGSFCLDNKGCLSEGANGETAVCGNGVVEPGESCDGTPFPLGCDTVLCLPLGSNSNDLATCGNSVVEEGEACDDGNMATGDGCDVNCLNESTVELEQVGISNITFNIDATVVDFIPSNYFEQNTSYRAFFAGDLTSNVGKPLGRLNYDLNKDGTDDSFSWSFTTNEDFCQPNSVRVNPEDKTLYSIKSTQDYDAGVYGAPDSCNAKGQKLNPYDYNWEWSSNDTGVATITNGNLWPSCGNQRIERGEECDDGNTIAGDGCSDVCLNEGTSRDMGLVSYWTFDEGADVFAYDEVGDNNGTLVNGPIWGSGKFGGALKFDGESDYVEIKDNVDLNITDKLTLSVWFKANTNSGSFMVSREGSVSDYVYGLYKRSGGNEAQFYIRRDSTSDKIFVSTTSVMDNQWHHLVGVFDGTSLKVYLDGVLENVKNIGADSIESAAGTPFNYIGTWKDNSSYFDGFIDDVRIYNNALTGAQIVGIMNQKDYICGNGVIDFGEDCDGVPFPSGCDINTCLNTGSVTNIAVCGNNILETGEDCDDSNTSNGDGCNNICLNEGVQTDSFIDFYQIATSQSPGDTDIEAVVNYCSNNPVKTCGDTLPACDGGSCEQVIGTGELAVVCGFSSDLSCVQGACSPSGYCTNNANIPCTPATETIDCDLSSPANAICSFETSDHTCSVEQWGGTCSESGQTCYSNSACPDGEACIPSDDCNYCNNNTAIECRSNKDCNIGVGYDSCCYSSPSVENNYPDPDYFAPEVISCNNNATPTVNNDDYCDAFGPGEAVCQTYSCDPNTNTCSGYGKCSNGANFAEPTINCRSDLDCPQDTYSTCNKSCSDDSDCNDITCGSCRNAQISITFDKLMDADSFTSDGVCSNNSSQSCAQHSDCTDAICLPNIRLGVKYDDAAISQKNCPTGYYVDTGLVYSQPKNFIGKIVEAVKSWFNKLVGRSQITAAPYSCAIPGVITSFDNNNRTTAIFTPQGLPNNIFDSGLSYTVTLKDGIKSVKGVSMKEDFEYSFAAGDIKCEPDSVDIYISE